MRSLFSVVAIGFAVSGVGLGMLLANWHPVLGAWLISAGLLYILYEFMTCAPIVRAVPEGMLRFLGGVMIVALGLMTIGPFIQKTLDPPLLIAPNVLEFSRSAMSGQVYTLTVANPRQDDVYAALVNLKFNSNQPEFVIDVPKESLKPLAPNLGATP